MNIYYVTRSIGQEFGQIWQLPLLRNHKFAWRGSRGFVPIWTRGNFPGSHCCRWISVCCGCRVEVTIFLLSVSQGLPSTPRGPISSSPPDLAQTILQTSSLLLHIQLENFSLQLLCMESDEIPSSLSPYGGQK